MIRKVAKELGIAFLAGVGAGLAEIAVEEGYKTYKRLRKRLKKSRKRKPKERK